MKKYTKLEWQYQGGHNASVEVNVGETTINIGRDEKNTGVYVISREEMEANAKLIAAAPDLLEALQGLMYGHRIYQSFNSLDDQHKYNEALRNAKAAIEKAIN